MSEGTLHPHAWLGDSMAGNAPCIRDGCGRLKLDKVHTGYRPIHTDTPPGREAAARISASIGEPATSLTEAMETAFPAGPVHATDLIPAVQAWDSFAARVRDTIIRKSAGYGNAWEEQGYVGNLARVLSKASRLRHMEWRDWSQDREGDHVTEESVLDTAHDMAALLAFFVANIDDGNRWGK